MVVKISASVDPYHEKYVPISKPDHWLLPDATEGDKVHVLRDFLRYCSLDGFSLYLLVSELVPTDGRYSLPGKLTELEYLVGKGCLFLGRTARKTMSLLVPHELKREDRLELVAINRLGLRQ